MPSGYPELEQLAPDEKLILAAELWREATSDDGAPAVDDRIVSVLQERLKDYKVNPDGAVAWDKLKSDLLGHD